MADTKVSAAASAAPLLSTDMLPIARSGNTNAFHAAMSDVATFTNTAIPAASSTTPSMDGTAAVGTGTTWARADHVHPTDTSRYAASNPSGYQTAAQVTTALAPYAPLAAPVFTGDARAVTPAYGDNDTSVATSAFVQSAVAPAANNVGRNRLHNIGFTVNQRSYTSGTALAAGVYGHDRWKGGASGCTYTFTQSYPTTTITITAGSLQQVVEAIGVAGGTYTLSWTGTAQGRVNAGTYAASPVTVVGLAANTAITVEFNAGTLGAIQLELGTQPTALDAGGSPAHILAECQRFYSIGSNVGIAAAGVSGQWLQTTAYFPVAMRAVPTIAFNSTSYTNASGLTAVYATGQSTGMYAVASTSGITAFITSYTASADL